MKKRVSLFILSCLVIASCRNQGNTSISFSESDHYYSMKALFPESKTRQVEHYMDKYIGEQSNMSFANTRIDGQIGLDDHTHFYIKKHAGYLQIKLNKDENSEESYERVREMCQEIKTILSK